MDQEIANILFSNGPTAALAITVCIFMYKHFTAEIAQLRDTLKSEQKAHHDQLKYEREEQKKIMNELLKTLRGKDDSA